MPWWAWIVFILIIVRSIFRLSKAWKWATSRFGPFDYSRQRDPFVFWMMVVVDLITVIFFTGFSVLIIRHQLF